MAIKSSKDSHNANPTLSTINGSQSVTVENKMPFILNYSRNPNFLLFGIHYRNTFRRNIRFLSDINTNRYHSLTSVL